MARRPIGWGISRQFRGRMAARVENFARGGSDEDTGVTPVEFGKTENNVVTSKRAMAEFGKNNVVADGWHLPVLDLDYSAELVPSSTPGHYHLYLNRPCTWDEYRKVLVALADAGLIEPGYAEASIKRGYSVVRLPWVHKEISIPTDIALADWVKRLLA